MELVHLSDWHCGTAKLDSLLTLDRASWDKPDILLVTGDMLPNSVAPWDWRFLAGSERTYQRSIWLSHVEVFKKHFPGLPIVAVPGNHDFCDYGVEGEVFSFDDPVPAVMDVMGLKIGGFRGVEYLEGYWNHEFSDHELDVLVSQLDPAIDILVTHPPPRNILDAVYRDHSVGVKALRDFVDQTPNLKLHAFGHIHEEGGKQFRIGNTIFSNAACRLNVIKF